MIDQYPISDKQPDTIAPRFAIVIPMLDEAAGAPDLLRECVRVAESIGPYEICITNDGSSDETGAVLAAFRTANPRTCLTIVTHAQSAGQSAALHTAVKAARAPIICTLDGDGQNPPAELPALLAPFLAETSDPTLGLVAGQRAKRNDPVHKRLASRAANAIRGWLLRDNTRDSGCGLKAYRRDAYLALPYFNHMHRFLPALFLRDGWRIMHVDVAHRPRAAGRSKYTNLGRALSGISDLLGVAWLIRRKRMIGAADVIISRPAAEA